MKTTRETIGTVKHGTIILPSGRRLPDGTRVRVVWEPTEAADLQPYDRERMTETEVTADLEWATGKRFAR